eukprot:2383227-Pyramimonas_sp.AAC.1
MGVMMGGERRRRRRKEEGDAGHRLFKTRTQRHRMVGKNKQMFKHFAMLCLPTRSTTSTRMSIHSHAVPRAGQ